MILTLYLIRNIFSYSVTVSLVFLFIVVSSRSIQYLEQAAQGELETASVIWMIIYRLPEFMQLILPFGFFLSIILVLGRLYSDNEMVIMNQSGFTKIKLYKLIGGLAVLMSMIVAIFSFWLTPLANLNSQNFQAEKTPFEKFSSLQPDIFHNLNQEGIFFAAEKEGFSFKNIFSKSLLNRAQGKDSILLAERAYLNQEDNTLVFEKGFTFSELKNGKEVKLSFEKILINYPEKESPNYMSSFLIQKSSNTDFTEDWQWKISLPLLTLIISLIAIPLSRLRPRQGRYQKVLPALVIFVGYLGFLILAKTWFEQGVYENFITMSVVHFIFLSLGLYLIRREVKAA